MKIISFAAIKGGVGKTTLAFNWGEWLAGRGHKVLFIDLDHQCNLTQTYDIYASENTVANVFKRVGEVDLIQVKDNITVLPGYMQLDSIEKELENKDYKNMLLYMWLEDNYDSKNLGQFDYVIIDCHPDFSTATKNAIAVSHVILSPLIPSEYGYGAKFNIEDRLENYRKDMIDYRTRESYITAQLFFLANMVKHNTSSSRELLDSLDGEDNVLAIIPSKELFNRSTLDKMAIAEMQKDSKLYSRERTFFDKLNQSFENIKTKIDV